MTIYNLIEACDACSIDTSRLRVIVYLLEHTNPKREEVKVTYDEIAHALGVSFSVVAKTMKLLQEKEMIQSAGRGKWKWITKVLEPAEEEEAEEFNLYLKNYFVS